MKKLDKDALIYCIENKTENQAYLCQELNARGYTSVRGKPLSQVMLSRWLRKRGQRRRRKTRRGPYNLRAAVKAVQLRLADTPAKQDSPKTDFVSAIIQSNLSAEMKLLIIKQNLVSK